MVTYWPAWVLMILILGIITRPFMRKEAHERLGQKAISLGFLGFMNFLVGIRIVRIFDDDLKKHATTPGPLIIASNHPALWDAVLIIRRVAWVSCIMKKELTTNPFLCSGACFAGFISNTPRLDMIRTATRRLKAGGRLLLFPEGTRTRDENHPVNPFRPGLALIAKQSGAPILPVFISSDSRYLQKGWPIWSMPTFPITVKIRVGEQISINPEERVRDFSMRIEETFRSELT